MAIPGFRLDWKAAAILKRERNASRLGIDDTLVKCVSEAKRNWNVRQVVTGTAQGSIMFQPAEIHGERVTGRWGSFDVDYFIWLEIGARGVPGDFMLRRAADQEYPKLPERIKARFKLAA